MFLWLHRKKVAEMIGAVSPENEITFTSGGTEVRYIKLNMR
jgi:hypothetical protein